MAAVIIKKIIFKNKINAKKGEIDLKWRGKKQAPSLKCVSYDLFNTMNMACLVSGLGWYLIDI